MIKILVIDDVPVNRKLLGSILQKVPEYEVLLAASGKVALESIEENLPDIILLDIMMPDMDGFEVARRLKANPRTTHIPVIFITALDDIDSKITAFEVGGSDYISKPFNPQEVLRRLTTQVRLKQYTDSLETMVQKRTEELEQLNLVLVSAFERTNYYNDDDTGKHIQRVQIFSRKIAEGLGMDGEMVSEIYRYSSLHDVGKVAIPDGILKKPGKLTPEEFEVMKSHTTIGLKILDFSSISQLLKNIVYSHHEKWNGSGYPQGLAGESIPIEARVVAIADVYDALRSRRPYKEPFDTEKSFRIINESSGSHFDPKIVEVFTKNREELERISREYGEE